MPDNTHNQPTAIIAGAVLLAASLAAALFMSQHPTLGSQGYENLAHEVITESGLTGTVHGAMILFALAYYYGLSALSSQLGKARAEVRAAQLAIGVATIAMVGAPLISGFILPDLAEQYAGSSAANEQVFRSQLILLGTANQVLAKLGTIGYAAAILFWSVRLIRMSGLWRIAGGFGAIAGPALLYGILSARLTLDVFGMTMVIIIVGLWFSLIAVQLMRAHRITPHNP